MGRARAPQARQPTAADWAFIAVCMAIGIGTLIGGLIMLLQE